MLRSQSMIVTDGRVNEGGKACDTFRRVPALLSAVAHAGSPPKELYGKSFTGAERKRRSCGSAEGRSG
jgi:hypothetical protein